MRNESEVKKLEDGTEIENIVSIPHKWEVINDKNYLIAVPVSDYIRELENDLKEIRAKLAEELMAKHNK